MTVNIGVVGLGNMGALHCRVFSEIEGAGLAAVCDIDSELAEKTAERYKATAYTDLDRMLKEENLDAVSIAVPTRFHFEAAKKAIEAGKSVLVEKPITRTIEEAKELIALAEKHNVKLMVGHIERFNPVIQFTKDLIQQKKLGETLLISTKRVGKSTTEESKYGDITLDLAIHDIDIIRFLTGQEVVRVYCDRTQTTSKDYIDNAFATLKLSNGTLGVIETSWITQKKVRKLTLTTEKATIDIDYITQDIEIHKGRDSSEYQLNGFENYLSYYTEGVIEKPMIMKKEPLKEELKHFVDCVKNNKEPMTSGKDGLKALEVALALNDSIKTGNPVLMK